MNRPAPRPLQELPPQYREVQHLVLLEPGRALRLNLLALGPLPVALAGMAAWWPLVLRLRGPFPGGPNWPWWLWVLLVLVVVLPLHELFHGLAIRWAGHKPRYGILLRKGALYATADGALFPRRAFLVIALAPLVGITLVGLLLVYLLPDTVGYYVGLAVALNAGSAIGDLWMAAVVWPYPAHTLIRDEMDSLRIYLPQ
ncbi:MAG TPA: DUF3267 domain-containing protein [Phototrophicaceae bacterium]|nr:DUF3267 domain-containing protein [Phototrophicaceae bacterium]